ncbi:tRNA(Ile)-lysidine synthase N-terminal [Arabidopsis thaliana x Arabidopsis arenosa]|uniref:tRNA(Ile)-lysidine synthetase n=1 Tax=Arabidopsis thaliana x Arabidopsis arenosa TaxID=1240361 RepID=A0A8T2AWC0_9BRAS|nr:tRNA(Ile)-lysidine synthase N-terminal [Arabidopsis thaliana x Arabidopsis arenosa]
MARGLALCSNGRKSSTLLSNSILRVSFSFSPKTLFTSSYPHQSRHPKFSRLFCNHTCVPETVDETKYKEVFNKRMAMAGLKPHHRIALGVSGGPDSMALCVLTAKWKTEGLSCVNKTDGFIDGLVAIVVDHGLRQESKDEAELVCSRVSQMGIRCEIASCDWVDGRPKLGHLQEAAREMRYQMISNVCFRHQIEVLLIAHHADDQAELFILRLSRSSGVLGLAGTAFASEIFSRNLQLDAKHMKNKSILLVRPLLDLWKEDMYKICQWGRQDWVEDPTNRSQLFVRNRIRTSIGNLQSGNFKSELQAVISECRRTRSFVDKVCTDLISQTVTVTDKGYAILDLERLNPTEVKDICLSKYLAAVLQFISQRQRPIRGNTSKLLLNYIRAIPCRTSLTAAGCYLSSAPGSKGTKIIVSCSVDCPLPSKTELVNICVNEAQKKPTSDELSKIISDATSISDQAAPSKLFQVQFLDVASESVLSKARELNLLSESTYTTIGLLQRNETNRFITKTEDKSVEESEHGTNIPSSSDKVHLWPGQNLYFMTRFLIRWNLSDDQCDEAGCGNCPVRTATSMEVRHMVESDWLYLAELSKCSNSNHSMSSSQKALRSLKLIPAAARKSLPVLINHCGLLLSVPAIGFNYCPCLEASAVFLPGVPLGGGHSSFL